MSIGDQDVENAQKTIKSILTLAQSNIEILISSNSDVIQSLPQETETIHYMDLQTSSLKDFLRVSTGDFFVCCEAGDQFDPKFLQMFLTAIEEDPTVELLYCDSDQPDSSQKTSIPFFKPSLHSPELLYSLNYYSRSLIKKQKALESASSLHDHHSLIDQEWELVFMLFEKSVRYQHIPGVFQHLTPKSTEEDKKQIISSHFSRTQNGPIPVIALDPKMHLSWNDISASVSIIIPNHNKFNLLKNLIDSIFNLTNYKNFEIIIVDNNSDDADLLAYYQKICQEKPVRIVEYNRPFNYSEAVNLGVKNSTADLVLFLNNDMQVLEPNWLLELAQWAIQPGIGVVGAKLLHEKRSIQHAGIVIGLNGFLGHIYLDAPEHYVGFAGSVDWYRNYCAVTGACQMIRRDLFNQVSGYDERFKLVFSDIEFCLRIMDLGYRNLYNPYCSIIHYEGKSRGKSTPISDILLGFEVLADWLKKDDPYFSPKLTYTNIPTCNFDQDSVKARLESIEVRKQAFNKAINS